MLSVAIDEANHLVGCSCYVRQKLLQLHIHAGDVEGT
jgi:hypothetical protein